MNAHGHRLKLKRSIILPRFSLTWKQVCYSPPSVATSNTDYIIRLKSYCEIVLIINIMKCNYHSIVGVSPCYSNGERCPSL